MENGAEIQPNISEKRTLLLEAKREARRKRILENSLNRLEKISGRSHTEEPVTRDDFGEIPPINEIHEDPEIERDVYERPSPILTTNNFSNENFNIETEFLQSFFQAPGNNLFTQQSFNVSQQIPSSSTSINPTRGTTIIERLIDTKIHIVVISTVVYVLFATGNQMYTSNNVFLYLLLWELAEMGIIKPRSKANGSLLFGLASALLLKNLDPKIKNLVSSALSTMNKVFKDVAIFMFVFVCIHIGWEYIGSSEPKTFIEILGK